jgi:hypothetical protein
MVKKIYASATIEYIHKTMRPSTKALRGIVPKKELIVGQWHLP